jgi:hypothetical protein
LEQYQTFIVRLSREAVEDGLRGQIEHVGTRRAVYFSDPAKMLSFMDAQIARWTASPGRRPDAAIDSDQSGLAAKSEE